MAAAGRMGAGVEGPVTPEPLVVDVATILLRVLGPLGVLLLLRRHRPNLDGLLFLARKLGRCTRGSVRGTRLRCCNGTHLTFGQA